MKIYTIRLSILVLAIMGLSTLITQAGTVLFSNFGSTLEIQSDGIPVNGGFVAVGTSVVIEENGFALDAFSIVLALEADFQQFGDSAEFGGVAAFNIDGFFSGVAQGDSGADAFEGKNILLVGGDGTGIADSENLFLINTDVLFGPDAPLFAADVDLNSGSILLGSKQGESVAAGVAGAFQMHRVSNPLVFDFFEDTAKIIDCDQSVEGVLEIPRKIQGQTVTSIGDNAFRDCVNLTQIQIPDTITDIGIDVFINCNSLSEIIVLNSNNDYSSSSGVLFNKEKTILIKCPARISGNYKVPDTVRSILDRAFYGCFDLTDVTLSSSLLSIGESAFRGCKGIKNIIIPDTVESIGGYAFLNCTSLASFSVASSNRFFSSENGVLFNKEKSVLIVCGGGKTGNYVIPESVKTIGNAGFGFCVSLTGITLPDKLNAIGDYAIISCVGLENIIIPSSVKSIGDYAFRECENLNRILLQGNAPSLGLSPFSFISSEVRIDHPATASGYSYPFGGIITYPMLPIIENFDGNSIDENLWVIGTTALDENSVVNQTNQSLNLQGGGHLATRNEYDPSSDGVAINGAWTFSSLGSDADSSNVIKGNVSIFNGPDDLLLDAGTNVIAVNINGSDEALNVNGVTFLSSGGVNFSSGGAPPETVENSGVRVNTISSHALSPWQGRVPEFGGKDSLSADNLEKIMQGLRYSRSSKGFDLESVIKGLDKDYLYDVQLLFHEIKASHWEGKDTYRRRFDIAIQGELVVDHFDVLGGESWSESNGVVYSGKFSPDQQGHINILLGRQPVPGDVNNTEFIRSWPPDSNPILQAVIIHELGPKDGNGDGGNNDVSFEDKGDYFQVFTQSDAVRDEVTDEIKNGVEFRIHTMTGELQILSRGGVRVVQTGASTLGRIDEGEQFDFQITDDGDNASFLIFEKGKPERRAHVKARVLSDTINKNHVVFKNRSSNDGIATLDDLTINDFSDADDDGLADWWELKHGLDINLNDGLQDTDNDGLTNIDEFTYFSDPNNSDTDGDLLSDGYERGYGRYVAVKGQFNWEEAVINASEMGGSLATFDTEGHWRIALDTLGAKGLNDFIGVWIGAQKNEVSQEWEWFNGDRFNFDKWGPGQPLSLGGSGKAAVSGGFGSSPYLWEEVPTRGVRDGYLMFIGDLTDPSISDTDGDGWNDGTEIEFGSIPINIQSKAINKSRGELIYDESLQPKSYEFRFSAAYGFRYSVQLSKDLLEWNTVEQGIIGEGGTVSRIYPFDEKAKFFKAVRE